MTYNIDALKRLRDNILLEAEAGRHDQGDWAYVRWSQEVAAALKPMRVGTSQVTRLVVACPTAACAAGHTVLEAGAKMVLDLERVGTPEDGDVVSCDQCITADGDVRGVSEYARELLGLSIIEADTLFHSTNTTEVVVEYIDHLLGRAEQCRDERG